MIIIKQTKTSHNLSQGTNIRIIIGINRNIIHNYESSYACKCDNFDENFFYVT